MKTLAYGHLPLSFLAAGFVACGSASGDPAKPDAAVGAAVLHLDQVPAGERCLVVVAKGSTRTEARRLDIVPGQSAKLPISRLPVGAVEFDGRAYASACTEVATASIPDYVSDPVSVILVPRLIPQVALVMKRNGQAAVAIDWEDDGSVCKVTNVALGASMAGSDAGWGGGSFPEEVVDGVTCYSDWPHGLAFTGGTGNWNGEACGWRQATVDFGQSRRLTGPIDVYHHGAEHVPNTVRIEVDDGSGFREVLSTTDNHAFVQPDTCPVGSTPTHYDIGATTASRVRYWLNNCDITHGWLYEITVDGCE